MWILAKNVIRSWKLVYNPQIFSKTRCFSWKTKLFLLKLSCIVTSSFYTSESHAAFLYLNQVISTLDSSTSTVNPWQKLLKASISFTLKFMFWIFNFEQQTKKLFRLPFISLTFEFSPPRNISHALFNISEKDLKVKCMEKYFSFLLKRASRISPYPHISLPHEPSMPNIFYSLLLNHIIQFIETTNKK